MKVPQKNRWEYPVSLAPMMGYTDIVLRQMIKQFLPEVVLFTEMIPANIFLKTREENCESSPKDSSPVLPVSPNGVPPVSSVSPTGVPPNGVPVSYRALQSKKLKFLSSEHPVIVQLGGDDPHIMKRAAKHCLDLGYDGVDINVGCPSRKVEAGNFGVVLMRNKDNLKRMVESMLEALEGKIPLSIKCRLGIVGDSPHLIKDVLDICVTYGIKITVHARMADLNMNTKKNRQIPPLDYDRVYALRKQYSSIDFQLNGGINTVQQVYNQYQQGMPVMIGRAFQHNPYFATQLRVLFGGSVLSRSDGLQILLSLFDPKTALKAMMQRHLPSLFFGMPVRKRWTASVEEWAKGRRSSESLHATCVDLEKRIISEDQATLIEIQSILLKDSVTSYKSMSDHSSNDHSSNDVSSNDVSSNDVLSCAVDKGTHGG